MLSRRHCCHRTQQCILCVVFSYTVTVNYIKITIVAQCLNDSISAGNNNILVGLNVQSRMFLTDFNQIWTSSINFHASPQHQIWRNSVQWEPHVWKDGRTDMREVISGLHGYANASKKRSLWPNSVLGSARTETVSCNLAQNRNVYRSCWLPWERWALRWTGDLLQDFDRVNKTYE